MLKFLSGAGHASFDELFAAIKEDESLTDISQIELTRKLRILQDQYYLAVADEHDGQWIIGPRAHLELAALLKTYYDAVERPTSALPQVLYY